MEPFWQLVSTFLLLVVEEMGVPLPFVTSSLMVALGVAWREGSMPLWTILVITTGATIVGSLLLYALGRSGRRALADRLMLQLAVNQPRRTQLEARLREDAFWAILAARFVPGLAPVASLLAGALGVSIKVLLAAALTASTGWTLFWLTGGSLGYGLFAPLLAWLPPRIQLPVAVFCVALLLSLLIGAAKALLRVLSKLICRQGR